MQIEENILLGPYTTLRIGGPARYFAEVGSLEELKECLDFAKEKALPIFFLGGGSNVLVSDRGFEGLIIRPLLMGRRIISETDDIVMVEIGAGEVLDSVIGWTVENGWWGMENLSFVPGLAGALVVQNVNAYGVKAEHVVASVRVFDRAEEVEKVITAEGCMFRYRGSIFNKEQKDRYVILSVTLGLKKKGAPVLGYVDVQKHFSHKVGGTPDIREMRETIINIRKGKGFDPEKNWSAGSFFSNLMLDKEESVELERRIRLGYGEELADKYKKIVEKFYEEGERDPEYKVGKIKIPTGFILDQVLGLKGHTLRGAQVSQMHAQTFLNTGTASAKDIFDLYKYVKNLAKEKLGLELVHEPEFVGEIT